MGLKPFWWKAYRRCVRLNINKFMENKMKNKNELKTLYVYGEDNNRCNTKKIEDYIDNNVTFKYVLFRGIYSDNSETHLLRLSPLSEFEDKLFGDTHLTIIGKFINEFKENRGLRIGEIDFRQDSGHGLLWLINEKEEKKNHLIVCAEAGAYMDIKYRNISFRGESKALEGGKVYDTDKIESLLIRKANEINPIHSIPAKMIRENISNFEIPVKIYVPNIKNERVEFSLEKYVKQHRLLEERKKREEEESRMENIDLIEQCEKGEISLHDFYEEKQKRNRKKLDEEKQKRNRKELD